MDIRDGRKCVLPQNRNLTRNVRDILLPTHGAKLFNALPRCCNLSAVSVNQFKNTLDRFLRTVPDEPQLPGYTTARIANTNSIIDMIYLGDLAFQVTETRRQTLNRSP